MLVVESVTCRTPADLGHALRSVVAGLPCGPRGETPEVAIWSQTADRDRVLFGAPDAPDRLVVRADVAEVWFALEGQGDDEQRAAAARNLRYLVARELWGLNGSRTTFPTGGSLILVGVDRWCDWVGITAQV